MKSKHAQVVALSFILFILYILSKKGVAFRQRTDRHRRLLPFFRVVRAFD